MNTQKLTFSDVEIGQEFVAKSKFSENNPQFKVQLFDTFRKTTSRYAENVSTGQPRKFRPHHPVRIVA